MTGFRIPCHTGDMQRRSKTSGQTTTPKSSSSESKLPGWLFTVTPISRVIAMFVFIGLPFLSFYLGMKYQDSIDTEPQIEVCRYGSSASRDTIPSQTDAPEWRNR